MQEQPKWISISDENKNSDLFLATLNLVENKNELEDTAGCTGRCKGGECRS